MAHIGRFLIYLIEEQYSEHIPLIFRMHPDGLTWYCRVSTHQMGTFVKLYIVPRLDFVNSKNISHFTMQLDFYVDLPVCLLLFTIYLLL